MQEILKNQEIQNWEFVKACDKQSVYYLIQPNYF